MPNTKWLFSFPLNTNKLLQKKDLDGNQKKYRVSNVSIANSSSSDDGNYTCAVTLGERRSERVAVLDLSFPGRLPGEVKWWKRAKDNELTELASKRPNRLSLKQFQSKYDLHIHNPEDNGTYVCEVFDPVTSSNITGTIDVMVYAPPQVVIDTVIPISASQLFLNWTIRSYNSPIKSYNLMYRKLPSTDFSLYTREKIGTKNISFVMEGLEKSTNYQLKLEVTTMHGQSKPHIYESTVRTLDKDPIFVPNISINGFSATSVTIGWAPPPEDIAELIHYYLLEARKMEEVAPRRAYHSRDSRNLPYMFDNLEPHSTYVFRVCSCSDFTKKCGAWSSEMQAATLDGTPGRPANIVENDRYMFTMHLPRISERNGPICCYRVYMVRLLGQEWASLPAPRLMPVLQYEEAHSVRPTLAAYVTDLFSKDYMKNPMMMDKLAEELEGDWEDLVVRDGLLDPAANYTLFVELIPGSEHDEPIYSEYVNATCVCAGVAVLVSGALCVMQSRSSRKTRRHLESNPIQAALRYVVGGLGGRQGTHPVPEMPPIPQHELAAAYAERQADSDYGFQKEFEERKKFICAQGPTDTTVNDFWRMIWEQGLELIVMLTNLEEYSKVKCSKYWPDEVRGARAFGAITVHHVSEKRYSDYIVRELRISKQPVNSEGQPIVENNGVAKRNGDCGMNETTGSAPTSPREQLRTESRVVRQYHFLMWKDFAAPEHPHSILRFIKRVNEAWSTCVSRCALVHCSAGVGRTGTLVALDCLLDQLRDTAMAPVAATKMMNPPVAEASKSWSAALAEEVRSKNRCQECLPYDRNRLGDGKCPRYWDDGTAQYEHLALQYEHSESCPYYTRRHFTLLDNKLQYHGWPTAAGHVPEVTRGLCELAELVRDERPLLVHCARGAERAAPLVALCVLARQLRAERRVDLQYEFLHRAILNYAELHNLLEDS
ncbi:unnamed protein product [Leptidea sinapis]|uniref:protein-tyrosine-phosphatase n=1 Tax=Leptidea sinapis TaxID=189913 RepID=A0A5E4PWB7_9NEOP|nr:unnamed protein product [Leptidea sinapis]